MKKDNKKALKKAVKALDIDKYIELCDEDNKIEAFLKDYAKYYHVKYQDFQIHQLINFPNSKLTIEMYYKLLTNSKLNNEKEVLYYKLLDDEYKTKYFIHIFESSEYLDKDLSIHNNFVLINDEILDYAIINNKLWSLVANYSIGINMRKKLIRYIENNDLYNQILAIFASIRYKLNSYELEDYLQMILQMDKYHHDNEMVNNDNETNYYFEKDHFINTLANKRGNPIYYDSLRKVILNGSNGDIICSYMINFKDFNIPLKDFERACESSQKLFRNFSELTDIEISKLSDEQVKILLLKGRASFYNEEELLHDIKIPEYNSRFPKIVKEVIDELLIDVHPSVTYEDVKNCNYKAYKEEYMKKVFININRIITLIKYLDNNDKDYYIDKLVDVLIEQEKYDYKLDCMDEIYNKINPVILATKYKITNKITNDKIVNYMLGEGNEIDLKRLKKYDKYIEDIKYLDDENILKIAPFYINSNNSFVYRFMYFVNNITNIDILENIVLATNNTEIINCYYGLRAGATYYYDNLSKKKLIK